MPQPEVSNSVNDDEMPEGLLIDLDAELEGEGDALEEDWNDSNPIAIQGGEYELRPERSDINTRLDKYVATQIPALSRTYVQSLIDQNQVFVDGQPRRAAFKMTPGEVVTLTVPEAVETDLEPEAIPLDIIYEDDDLIVLNKPAGMVVHPAAGHPNGTLVNALIHHAPEINVGGSNRPGIIHRLDRDTSGVMVVVKTTRARTSLVAQWQARTVEKGYIALCHGVIEEDEATIDAPIARDPQNRKKMSVQRGGRDSVTHVSVNERLRGATLFDVDLETGRTHQIRVHLAFIGHPIVGDELYNRYTGPYGGKGAISNRQFLHAARLAFRLPDGQGVEFEAPLPGDLRKALDRARLAAK